MACFAPIFYVSIRVLFHKTKNPLTFFRLRVFALELLESWPMLPLPRFPEYALDTCGTVDAGVVGVDGGVFSGESRLLFKLTD